MHSVGTNKYIYIFLDAIANIQENIKCSCRVKCIEDTSVSMSVCTPFSSFYFLVGLCYKSKI